MIFFIVETFLRKICSNAIHEFCHNFAQFSIHCVPDKMMVFLGVVVEQSNKNFLISNKAASDERIAEFIIRHREIV